MLRHFSKLAGIVALAALSSVVVLAQAQEKKVKDQAEYDLFTAATKATDPTKKVALLNTWKEKYPQSDFKEDIQVMLINTYRELGQGENMFKSAQDLLAMNPKSTPALYWLTLLTISLNNTTPERLDIGEKASRGLMAYIESELTPEKRPQTTPEADWNKQRDSFSAQAIKTLGWVEMSRKSHAKAEEEFVRFLKLNPNSGTVSYWLGSVMLAQQAIEKQVPALFHFARAAHYKGDDELPAEAKKQVQGFFERNYTKFHGGKEGMPEVIALALKSPFPPSDFEIKSAQQIAIEEENRLKEENPQLALWLGVKKQLLGPEGPGYFDGSLKGAALPKFKGKVVAQTPERRPKEITVALTTADTPEVKLVLDAPMANPAEPGTEIEFENGVGKEFASDPFLLTLDIEKANVTGWPAPARTGGKGGRKK